jgi:hypothetical protein
MYSDFETYDYRNSVLLSLDERNKELYSLRVFIIFGRQ